MDRILIFTNALSTIGNAVPLRFTRAEITGTDVQCSRTLTFSLPSNPYDADLWGQGLSLGDKVHVMDASDLTNQLFYGVITDRRRSAAPGEVSYTAKDLAHYLLRNRLTHKFENTTPEAVARFVMDMLSLGVSSLTETKKTIKKYWVEDACIYDIVVGAYQKATQKTGKRYIVSWDSSTTSFGLRVAERGEASGVTLVQGGDLTEGDYHDTTDDMVNSVWVYDRSSGDGSKFVGQVGNSKLADKYGRYNIEYQVEDGVPWKGAAKALLQGVTKEATVESTGDYRAVAGRTVQLRDAPSGFTGKFYITGDTHTWESGTHMMKLSLSREATAESGAVSVQDGGKKQVANKAKCWYLDGSSVYHSSQSCSALKGKGKALKKSTVRKMKKIKVTSGKNKGKRKYKPCAKCWIT